MSDNLLLEILTPEKQTLKGEASSVYVQGSEGRLGILPMHTSLIARLDFGQLDYEMDGQAQRLLCGTGIVEVHDNHVTVLVRSAERLEEIDVERAKQAMSRAKSRRDSKDNDIDMVRAEAALFRAVQRLKYVGKL